MSATAPDDPIVTFFDAHADRYWRQMRFERRALRAVAQLAEPLVGARVVDLGTGTGGVLAALDDRGPRVAALIAVDSSTRMLECARSTLWRVEPPPHFVRADARSVPLSDGAADVVTAGYLLHLLDAAAQRAVLTEAFRLLRPEGRLIVVVHSSPRGLAGFVYRAIWRSLALAHRRDRLRYRPMIDIVPTVQEAGFLVDATWHVPGVYWSQVLRARRPAARR